MANHQENHQAKRREKEAQESDGMGSPRRNMPAERKEHVCQVCQRRFISGKALGGHVSAHVQARKAKNRCTLEEEEEEEEEEDDDDEINVCEKHFPSKNSLKSHPDRAWRGMGRRAEAEEIQEEEEAAHEVVDLLGRLKPHWGATVKRERRKKMHGDVAPLRHLLDVADKEDKRIRRGGDFRTTQNKKMKKKKINAPSRMENKGKGKAHHHVSENPRFGRVKRSGSCSSEDTDEYYCRNHMEEIRINGGILNPKEIHRNKESLMEPERESKKKKRGVEVESAEEEREKKKCKCGRGFSSSQPLESHKEIMQQQNTNNKAKTEIRNTSNDNDENQSIGVDRRVESRRVQVDSPEIPTAAAARIPKVLRFDLNEMPDAAANVDEKFN